MTKRQMFGWGVCGSLAVAVMSFFMDYMSMSGYGISIGISGMEMLEAAFDYMEGSAVMIIIAALATVVALVIAVMSNLKGVGAISMLPMVLSVVSAICMFMAFTEDDAMEYAGTGFWLFMIAHIAAIVLSFMAKKADE